MHKLATPLVLALLVVASSCGHRGSCRVVEPCPREEMPCEPCPEACPELGDPYDGMPVEEGYHPRSERRVRHTRLREESPRNRRVRGNGEVESTEIYEEETITTPSTRAAKTREYTAYDTPSRHGTPRSALERSTTQRAGFPRRDTRSFEQDLSETEEYTK